MIWIMKSGRLPCQNASVVIDQFRAAAGIEFPRLNERVVFRPLQGGARLQILTIPEYISKNMGTSQDLRNSVELGEEFRNALIVSRFRFPVSC